MGRPLSLDNALDRLKRIAGDFNTFTEKTSVKPTDIFLIEDSDSSYSKKKVQLSNLSSVINHPSLSGLDSGDAGHPQFVMLNGRLAGQTIAGGTDSNETLTLTSTSNSTKGKIVFGSSVYDETKDFLGLGINAPISSLHIYGEDNTIGGTDIQHNTVTMDGVADGDKGFTLSDAGNRKWEYQIYRNEAGKYFYLYNYDTLKEYQCVSDTGRWGINKQSNILNPHSSFYGTGINDMLIDAEYSKNYQALYEIKISTASATDKFQWRKSLDDGLNYTSWSPEINCSTDNVLIEYGINVYFGAATGHTLDDQWHFIAFPQLPQGSFTVAPTYCDEILTTVDYTAGTPEYLNQTYQAGSFNSNEVIVLPTGTTGALYVARPIKYNSVNFYISTPGVGVTLYVEYYNGSSWTQLTALTHDLKDDTSNLTESGKISWDRSTLTGWTKTLPDGITDESYSYYWIRISSSSTITTAPKATLMSPHGDIRFGVSLGHFDPFPVFTIDGQGRTVIGGGKATGNNLIQVMPYKSQPTTAYTSSVFEIDSKDETKSDAVLRMSKTNPSSNPSWVIANSNGTLEAPTNLIDEDIIGSFAWRGFVDSAWSNLAYIRSQYKGDGSNVSSSLQFWTGLDSSVSERMRLSENGFLGIGEVNPTDFIHVYGTDNTPDENDDMTNNIMIDGVYDGDKGIVWAEQGNKHWQDYIYRGEYGEFKYLWNYHTQRDIEVKSRTGRYGWGKQSNYLNYHSLFTGVGLNDMKVSAVYTKPYQAFYEVQITSTGTPNQFKWRKAVNFTSAGVPNWGSQSTAINIVAGDIAIENGINVTFGATTGHTLNDLWTFGAFSQLPIGTFTIAPAMFSEIMFTTNYTSNPPTWVDRTYECASSYGANITMFNTGAGATNNAIAIGFETPFDDAYIALSQVAVGATLAVDYYNTVDSTWTTMTAGSHDLNDTTSNLTIYEGSIFWDKTLLTGWGLHQLEGESEAGYNLYWVRVRTTTNPTQSPIANVITPHSDKRFAVFAGHLDPLPALSLDPLGKLKTVGIDNGGSFTQRIDTYASTSATPPAIYLGFNANVNWINNSGGSQTVYLPLAAQSKGRVITIARLNTQTVVINGNGATLYWSNANSGATYSITGNTRYTSVALRCDGTRWVLSVGG